MGVVKKILDPAGVFSSSGGSGGAADSSAVTAATQAQTDAQNKANEIAAQQAQYAQELNNLSKNNGVDLTNDNRTNVETAGSANDAAAVVGNDDQKRRKAQSGLASTLGINV